MADSDNTAEQITDASVAPQPEPRRIIGEVRIGRRTYRPGDEDAVAHLLAPESVSVLVARGQLAGDWGDIIGSAPQVTDGARARRRDAPSSTRRGR